MAKKKSWLDQLKKFFGSDSKAKQEKKGRRIRWLFGRLMSKNSPPLPPPPLEKESEIRKAEEEQSKHALAVAVATAAAAEAAVAAAQAAAQVVRLTGDRSSYNWSREIAAIKIQSAFRGFLARKALRALKGLVKLQALVRGQAVRRKTTIALEGLESLMRIQTHACASRANPGHNFPVYKSRDSNQRKMKESADIEEGKERSWDGSILSKEEINSILRKRELAALKRERALEYASSYQERRNARRQLVPREELNDLNHRWMWLEQWVGSQPLDTENYEIHQQPSIADDTLDPNIHASDLVNYLHSSHREKMEEIQLRYLARKSFNSSRRTSLRDDDSFSSSPSFPNYMASTASTKARFRSMSTPKQRFVTADIFSDHCYPYTDRVQSPIPSIVSDASLIKATKSPLFLQGSPRLKGQAGPVKSRRSSGYLSFDSECSLLNLDQHNGFR
ncbi:protein IQ-DOMAIN 14-like isoform X2 [Ananas comosus]|nr:protein IQ-DOMAIN 14-like isoform X2 [Ananas comosus]XP_020086243.1 protein IQ-DOMAIN 14-like isoform X2 [Ananas comosus]